MNRLKVWAYALLVLIAGIADVALLSRWLSERSIAQLDGDLRSGVAHVDALARLVAADAGQLADAVAHDPAVAQALAADGRDAVDVALAALQRAQGGAGVDARPTLVAVGTRSGVVAHSGGAPVQLDADGASMLGAAAARRNEGYLAVGDALWYVSAVPVGLGSSVAVGVPLDASWLALARAGTGCAVTLTSEGHKPRSTLGAEDLGVVLLAARDAVGRPVSAGKLPPQPAKFSIALPLPALGVPFADPPAFRVQAVSLRGAQGAIVLSVATAPLLGPVASYLWVVLAAVVVLFLLGLAIGLAVTNEQRAIVPKELVAVADRIQRGDFDARAPELAGSLGTVAAALNRAAATAQARASAAVFDAAPASEPLAPAAAPERAEPAAREPAPETLPSPEPEAAALEAASPAPADRAPANELFAEPEPSGSPAALEPAPGANGAAELPTASRWPEPVASGGTPAWAADLAVPPEAQPEPAAARGGDPFSAPAEHPSPAPEGALPHTDSRTEDLFPLPFAPPRAAEPAAAPVAAPASTPALAPAPDAEPQPGAGSGSADADEAHWRAVYDDFVRVRAECGEGPQAVAFDRFRQKLVKNREQLVEKYHCRTVKFQVYVKEGKAALKATPVR